MGKRKVIVLLLVFLALGFKAQAEVVWEQISRGETDVRAVVVHPDNPRIIFMGNNHGIFKSEDAGKNWRNVLSIRGQNKKISILLFAPQDLNSVYAATGEGLFVSRNRGGSWKRIFRGKGYLESECTALAVLPGALYLGTGSGLFISRDNGRSWGKALGKVGNNRIFAISYSPLGYVYVACGDGVYRIEKGQDSWERVFIAELTPNDNEGEEMSAQQDEEETNYDINYIACAAEDPNSLYLATSRGVYVSHNIGKEWQYLSEYGLLSRIVKFILVSKKSLIYAATERGVFEYSNERWQELSFGLIADKVRFLASDNQGNLYAACDRGLFKSSVKDFGSDRRGSIIANYAKNEPSINQVHKAAIKYAEVSPEKIKFWRRQASAKAIMPKLSAGVGRDTSDLWHWEGGSTTKLYDDILVKGKDTLDWDVTLTWDLSELIWNPDQTSIDVRSKLMVQLRDDILDEVTKLYFERIRVKMEIDNLNIEDRKKRCEKELKIQELTAQIDGLTGGYFSSHIQ